MEWFYIHSPDEFEQRIDSELAALDSLSDENNRLHRCSAASDDLLEFSDNSVDCELKENPIVLDSNITRDSSYTSTSTNIQKPVDSQVVNETVKNINHKINFEQNKLFHFTEVLDKTINPSALTNELKTHVDAINSSVKSTKQNDKITSSRASDLSRQSDHVSCEDLLEFACDLPNIRRTRGPHNGEQSDEVRIMLKVLQDYSTPESCVAALNVTNWDILAAIKLERLQGLLKKENNFVSLEDCKVMLSQCGGDVVKAAALLKNTEDTASV